MPTSIKYEDYYIAFLDILGFSNLLKTTCASQVHDIFSSIRHAKRLTTSYKNDTDSSVEIRKNTHFYFFSDSIICAIPSRIPDSFEQVTSNCMLIQHALWLQNPPVWVRGAITKGKLYCGKMEVFGPGLVDAYRLEECLAKYPRIIMLPSTYEIGISECLLKEEIGYISNTTDSLKMVETLRYFDFDQIENIRSQCINSLNNEKSEKIREKYLWIKDYYNSCIDVNSKFVALRFPI